MTLPVAFASFDDETLTWTVWLKPFWTGGIHKAVKTFQAGEQATAEHYAAWVAGNVQARREALAAIGYVEPATL